MKGDNPIAIRVPALLLLTTSTETPKSFDISGEAGKMQVLEKVAASVIQLVTNKIKAFRHMGYRSNKESSSG
jgi:hypothetical protein